jgi:uncharacterized protein (TIGR01777 family)
MKKFHKIVLAGGSGYLGSVFAKHYSGIANEVVILARKQHEAEGNITTITWDGQTEGNWCKALDNADLLINLCGKNVNCRYTAANRKAIIESRTAPTRLLNQVIAKMERPPKVWINVTSATIYRHAEDHAQDEFNGDIGYGFSIDVCKQWEESFFETLLANTRKVALRMGIVLGRADGAFPRLLNLVRLGLGGKQGDGEQYISWIHEQDAVLSTQWILESKTISGVVNCTSPHALKNKQFMQNLRSIYGIPFGLPCYTWLLALGAWLIGTETELILKSRWVAPKVLLESGFKFQYSEIELALRDLVSLRL